MQVMRAHMQLYHVNIYIATLQNDSCMAGLYAEQYWIQSLAYLLQVIKLVLQAYSSLVHLTRSSYWWPETHTDAVVEKFTEV